MSAMQFVNLVDFSAMGALKEGAPACAGPAWVFLQAGLPSLDGLVRAGPSGSWVVLMDKSLLNKLTPAGVEFIAQHELGHAWLAHDFEPRNRRQYLQRELEADAYAMRRVSIGPAELAGTWAVTIADLLKTGGVSDADRVRDAINDWHLGPRLDAMGIERGQVLHLVLRLMGL